MIYNLFNPGVVDSVNSIIAPLVGQRVFDKSNGRIRSYYGRTLGWQNDWGKPWGRDNQPFIQASVAVTIPSSLGDLPGLGNATVKAVTGRRISSWVCGQHSHAGAGSVTALQVTNSVPTVLNDHPYIAGSTSQKFFMTHRGGGAENGDVTRKMRGTNPSNTASVGAVGGHVDLMVVDLGNAIAPIIT